MNGAKRTVCLLLQMSIGQDTWESKDTISALSSWYLLDIIIMPAAWLFNLFRVSRWLPYDSKRALKASHRRVLRTGHKTVSQSRWQCYAMWKLLATNVLANSTLSLTVVWSGRKLKIFQQYEFHSKWDIAFWSIAFFWWWSIFNRKLLCWKLHKLIVGFPLLKNLLKNFNLKAAAVSNKRLNRRLFSQLSKHGPSTLLASSTLEPGSPISGLNFGLLFNIGQANLSA